jgi:glyoxylase-like metal-dependent hydrolase (beta-lactamase superfamily II)
LTPLDDTISLIDTMALGTQGVVAAYIVSGKEHALVDMGYASSAPTVLSDIEKRIGDATIDYLLPTHVHLDHSGACGSLAQSFVDATVRVHPRGERHLVNPSALWQGAKALFGDALVSRYTRPEPVDPVRVKPIGDGEVIALGDGVTLRAIWTPGHASHHLSYVVEETGVVLTGDAVGITYPAFPVLIPTTPPTSFDLDSAIESLQKLRNLSPKRLLTPHYGVVPDTLRSIDANIASIRRWVTKIEDMIRVGLSSDKITANLMNEIASPDVHDLPVYVQISVGLSVLGVMRYLSFTDRKSTG